MKRNICLAFLGSLFILMSGCSGNKNIEKGEVSEDFYSMSDSSKTQYLKENSSPAEVAENICNLALNPGNGDIDFIQLIENLYGSYSPAEKTEFSNSLNAYIESQPRDRRMKLYLLSGAKDYVKLGYYLGEGYKKALESKQLPLDSMRADMVELKKICGPDTSTYNKITAGMSTSFSLE